MRIVVTGASGNVGSAVVRELTRRRHALTGVARRSPERSRGTALDGVDWHAADVAHEPLDPVLVDTDALVHLAWMFQPTHDPDTTWRANAVGTRKVLEAASRTGIGVVVCASSVAAYSPARGDDPVDESWPTDGPSPAAYCREKAYVERVLDVFEATHPEVRVVRIRPAFVFQRSAASEQRRIFGAPALRPWMLDRRLLPLLPIPSGLRLQTVHADDLARVYAEAVERPVRGAFNVAADGLLRREELGEVFGAHTFTAPRRIARAALEGAWRARLAGAPGDLFDALLRVPVLGTARAKTELGWQPRHDAAEALGEMLAGAREGAGGPTPPLDPDSSRV
ncbi:MULTISPECIES: NAD-dependent epimerase/dehydratase family protein [Mumia]|uniref:NAD-dependent epimerase/dehydratase family protein n=1 Tax=Mumia TaxID=1546255 RepID=UPI001420A527|nr:MULTISPECIES: NAD-dependent epimerase/dehydratase family protein [unclassified Mumia]QMW66003.1 NAD-dependent epimerase/dehydratase family protein [Mumia sp. ZJ1417]